MHNIRFLWCYLFVIFKYFLCTFLTILKVEMFMHCIHTILILGIIFNLSSLYYIYNSVVYD